MTAREPRSDGGAGGDRRGGPQVERVQVASAGLAASRVEIWMAERRTVAPAVGFRPAVVEKEEPGP